MKLNFSVVLGVCSGLLALAGLATAGEPSAAVDYDRQIRPILSENCFACHGFDAKKRKSELRLDTAEGAIRLKEGRQPVKPHDVNGSELWRRVNSKDPKVIMPPPESGKKLEAEQISLLGRWI